MKTCKDMMTWLNTFGWSVPVGGRADCGAPELRGASRSRIARPSGVSVARSEKGGIRPPFCRTAASRPPCGARRARREVGGSKAGRFVGRGLRPLGAPAQLPSLRGAHADRRGQDAQRCRVAAWRPRLGKRDQVRRRLRGMPSRKTACPPYVFEPRHDVNLMWYTPDEH